jgi:hypothetical protein
MKQSPKETKASMMAAKRIAIPLLRKYIKSKGYSEIPKKDNDLYKIYCALENIEVKNRKLRDVALNEYRLGKLDKFIESNTTNEPIKVKKVKTKNKVQLKHSVKSVENIYQSTRWADTKKVVYSLYDFKCMKCGAKDKEMHVDHICPVSKYPAMKWSINNLQLLCKNCNMEKSNVNENDYRTLEQKDLCSKYMNGEI